MVIIFFVPIGVRLLENPPNVRKGFTDFGTCLSDRKTTIVVKELFLVRLYPEASGYELVKVPIMKEMMSQLFELRRHNL